ncbi:glucose-1-phosphate cytidylyltransferase [Trichlorobacter lovleyi]|uniref:glucose-1-phosphate cytidylyltransferase n=1 Tax=Trichlorobacter lovleyi TaxID=313985 RepID=UPI00223F93FA|nr:glucose-1-phosphate cytidylyltransferase [Trichlorobacter lovleyi]QOX79036.1 glucose-1-phosphate cytidylyltransferase [Trichlorobacter lovleyi]
MKVVILAGGLGTRISEESHLKPKPMIEIGENPILWHIMKIYSHYGFNDFTICLGYKGYVIKEYFANYFLHNSDVTFDLGQNSMKIHDSAAEPWKVTLVDTGLTTPTGGRLKRIRQYLGNETFLMTYGDGVANVNINKLLEFHRGHGRHATITAVQPPGRFGALAFEGHGDVVSNFQEKPQGDGSWINGGFFVLEPQVLDYIASDDILWEKEPLSELSRDGQLMAFRHVGFWKPMDTLRDKVDLEEQWRTGDAKWKVW